MNTHTLQPVLQHVSAPGQALRACMQEGKHTYGLDMHTGSQDMAVSPPLLDSSSCSS